MYESEYYIYDIIKNNPVLTKKGFRQTDIRI